MPKKKKIHPLIIVAMCCIALFCTAVLSLYIICGAGGDLASPPGDEDLQIFVETIEDDKNAYTYLYEVAKKYSSADAVSEFIEDSEYNEKKNPQQIATFLQETDLWNKNKEILALIDKALACQQSQVIVEHRDPDFSYSYLSNLNNLCTLIEINSFHLAYNKDIKHAMNLAMKIAQIGQRMQQASFNFTPYIWGTAIKVSAVCVLCELLTIAAVDNDFLTVCMKNIVELKDSECAKRAINAEYFNAKHNVDIQIAKYSTIKQLFFLKRNTTYKVLLDMYKDIPTIISSANYDNAYLAFRKKYIGYVEFTPNLSTFNNGIGKQAVELYAPIHYFYWHYKERTALGAATVVFALKMYKNDHGHTATSLSQLVPDYLEKLPKNYLNGAPLQYDGKTKVIFCSDISEKGLSCHF